MAIYLKKFENHTQYETYINGSDAILPNVSICTTEGDVHYNPWVETKLVVYYDIQDISSPTTVCTNYDGSFKSIEIDGDVSVDITTQSNITYQFDSVGEHVIKYEFNNPTSVGSNAPLLYQLYTAKRVIIADTFTCIGNNAFNSCYGLTSCTIGSGVTSIGSSAFQLCSGLTSITVETTTPPTLGSYAFSNTNNCPIYVPCESVNSYKSASGWSIYASRIQAIP